MLILMLLCTSGVSIEKCSCTGKVSLALPTEGDCCPDESGCMTVRSLQLSDYMPTMSAAVDMPVMPVLFALFSPTTPAAAAMAERQMETHSAKAPPEALAHTVTVLRV